MLEDLKLGKVAYEAYCKHTGGVSLVSGMPLPSWDEIDHGIKDAWSNAAVAVRYFRYEWENDGQ